MAGCVQEANLTVCFPTGAGKTITLEVESSGEEAGSSSRVQQLQGQGSGGQRE